MLPDCGSVVPRAESTSTGVQPPGAAEQQLASRYAFRTEQAGVTRLDSAVVASDSGQLTACGLAVR